MGQQRKTEANKHQQTQSQANTEVTPQGNVSMPCAKVPILPPKPPAALERALRNEGQADHKAGTRSASEVTLGSSDCF